MKKKSIIMIVGLLVPIYIFVADKKAEHVKIIRYYSSSSTLSRPLSTFAHMIPGTIQYIRYYSSHPTPPKLPSSSAVFAGALTGVLVGDLMGSAIAETFLDAHPQSTDATYTNIRTLGAAIGTYNGLRIISAAPRPAAALIAGNILILSRIIPPYSS